MIFVLLSKVEIRKVLCCSTTQISVISIFLCIFISFVYSNVLFWCMIFKFYLNCNGVQYSIKQLIRYVLFIIFTCNNMHFSINKISFCVHFVCVHLLFLMLTYPVFFVAQPPFSVVYTLYIFTPLLLNFLEGNSVLDPQPEYIFRQQIAVYLQSLKQG